MTKQFTTTAQTPVWNWFFSRPRNLALRLWTAPNRPIACSTKVRSRRSARPSGVASSAPKPRPHPSVGSSKWLSRRPARAKHGVGEHGPQRAVHQGHQPVVVGGGGQVWVKPAERGKVPSWLGLSAMLSHALSQEIMAVLCDDEPEPRWLDAPARAELDSLRDGYEGVLSHGRRRWRPRARSSGTPSQVGPSTVCSPPRCTSPAAESGSQATSL